jgi:L-threonylcarbamoyladenylate synthase
MAVYPTDTFYSLGGNALNRRIVERIYEIKQRPREKPIILLISRLGQFRALTAERSEAAEGLARSCWPGPLTLILPASEDLPGFLRGRAGTVALRIPSSPLIRQLIDACGCPLTGTSANISGRPSPSSVKALDRRVLDQIDLLIDGGDTTARQGSTIVDCTGNRPVLLRSGAFPETRLRGAGLGPHREEGP